ncbi:MAG TPA: ADOP family duplicated permease [Gemmatimonadaceae bacterium]|nr:ADOP family duplicated permease [Gemmatimonadaceae bacterium]
MSDTVSRWLYAMLRFYPADFREEMGDALVHTYQDRVRAARARAGTAGVIGVCIRAFGDSMKNGIAERLRPAAAWRQSGNWGRDTERAIRRLLRAPAFTISMLGTLIVGLGAFATVYTVVHKVMLAPLPYERANDLYYVWRDLSAIVDLKRGYLGGTDIPALHKSGGPIEAAVGLRASSQTLTRPGAASDAPEEISVLLTSANIFRVLGVRPLLGRGFLDEEEGEGKGDVIVLGHDLWRSRFGGDRAIVGSTVHLNGNAFRVVGVMGPEFQFQRHLGSGSPQTADAYVPFALDLAQTDAGNGGYAGFIRARAGTSPEVVHAAVTAVGQALDEKYFQKRGLKWYPVPLVEDLVGPVRQPLLVLGAAGGLLVLVLAVNMATLLLVRASQRDHEFAISRALGANSFALTRATLLEAGLLGVLGGAGGALVAVWGTRALLAVAPLDLPRRANISVDWQVALVVIALGLLLGLAAGILPATWSTRTPLGTLLRNVAVRGGGAHGGLRRAMVVVQVALSLVLLCAGALVIRSFDRLLSANPGFQPANLLTMRVPIPAQRYPEDAQARELQSRIDRELAAIPGVESVGATSALPVTDDANQTTIRIPGAPGNRGDERDAPLVDYINVRRGYFETMGIRLLEGRRFEASGPGTAREVVIDRVLARQFFPDGGAVGSRMLFQGDTLTVAGVVDHARMQNVHTDGRPQVYVNNDDYTFHTLTFVARSRRSMSNMVGDVRAAIQRVDPQLAIADVQTMDDVIGDALRQPKLSASLLGGFSVGALLLAAMGLYGVIAGSVNRRKHEMAVRLALGSDHGGLVRLVVGEGAKLVVLGLLIGVPGIYFAGKLLGGVLVGISAFDPVTLACVAGGLALIAGIACYVPARRVTSIAPAHALREG